MPCYDKLMKSRTGFIATPVYKTYWVPIISYSAETKRDKSRLQAAEIREWRGIEGKN